MKMVTERRPTSVAVIGWVITVWSGLYLLNLIGRSALDPTFRRLFTDGNMFVSIIMGLWGTANGVIGLVSGMAILRGINWGRLLYLLYTPVSITIFIASFARFGFFKSVYFVLISIIMIAFYIICLVCLTRSAASKFFRSPEELESSE
jgi:hypothetical protein